MEGRRLVRSVSAPGGSSNRDCRGGDQAEESSPSPLQLPVRSLALRSAYWQVKFPADGLWHGEFSADGLRLAAAAEPGGAGQGAQVVRGNQNDLRGHRFTKIFDKKDITLTSRRHVAVS